MWLTFIFYLLSQAAFASAKIELGAANSFAVLGQTTVTNAGLSILTGDVGVGATSITGFPPGVFTGRESISLSGGTAFTDATNAYNAIAALDPTILTGDLGGMVLSPGTYCYSSSASLTGTLTLQGDGLSNDTWNFQIGSSLVTATSSSVILTDGALACNVFWQIGSSATLGVDSAFQGTVLADVSVTLDTGASSNGGLFALTGAITLDTNAVLAEVCPAAVSSSSSLSSTSLGASTPAASSPTMTSSSPVLPSPMVTTSSISTTVSSSQTSTVPSSTISSDTRSVSSHPLVGTFSTVTSSFTSLGSSSITLSSQPTLSSMDSRLTSMTFSSTSLITSSYVSGTHVLVSSSATVSSSCSESTLNSLTSSLISSLSSTSSATTFFPYSSSISPTFSSSSSMVSSFYSTSSLLSSSSSSTIPTSSTSHTSPITASSTQSALSSMGVVISSTSICSTPTCPTKTIYTTATINTCSNTIPQSNDICSTTSTHLATSTTTLTLTTTSTSLILSISTQTDHTTLTSTTTSTFHTTQTSTSTITARITQIEIQTEHTTLTSLTTQTFHKTLTSTTTLTSTSTSILKSTSTLYTTSTKTTGVPAACTTKRSREVALNSHGAESGWIPTTTAEVGGLAMLGSVQAASTAVEEVLEARSTDCAETEMEIGTVAAVMTGVVGGTYEQVVTSGAAGRIGFAALAGTLVIGMVALAGLM